MDVLFVLFLPAFAARGATLRRWLTSLRLWIDLLPAMFCFGSVFAVCSAEKYRATTN